MTSGALISEPLHYEHIHTSCSSVPCIESKKSCTRPSIWLKQSTREMWSAIFLPSCWQFNEFAVTRCLHWKLKSEITKFKTRWSQVAPCMRLSLTKDEWNTRSINFASWISRDIACINQVLGGKFWCYNIESKLICMLIILSFKCVFLNC